MIDTIVTRAKGFLLDPVETFRQFKSDEPKTVFTYFCVLLLFHALILAALIGIFGIAVMPVHTGFLPGPAFPVMVFFLMLVGGCIATLVFSAWLHLWVYILGGRQGILQTVHAVIYGSTPRLLLGWIPLLGFLFMLWSLVLVILGIRELQKLDTLKAILAVAIAVMIPVILVILAAAWFLTSSMTVTPVPLSPLNGG